MQYLPDGWSPEKLSAFNALNDAALAFMIYDRVLTALNITDATLLQIRTDVGSLIKNQLGPTLRNTP